jgi:hypothetical protein
MGIGTSLFLIAVGAILYFAVDASISGLEITTIGIILMVVGVIGLLISLFMIASARRAPAERTVVRDRDVY